MAYARIESSTRIVQGNPFLISYLKSGKVLKLLFLKEKGCPSRFYVNEESAGVFQSSGFIIGNKIDFKRKGRKIVVNGDSRFLILPEQNIGDRISELLNEEEAGYIEFVFRSHHFTSSKKHDKLVFDENFQKMRERHGWKVIAKFENAALGGYLKHIFSGPSIRTKATKWGFNHPVLAIWEINYFLPSKVNPSGQNGIKIGTTKKAGDIYLDHEKNFHSLLVGSTGSGKSTMVVNIISEIVKNKLGKVILIDPHGDTSRQVEKIEAKKFTISPQSGTGVNVLKTSESKGVNYRVAEDFVSILKSTREMQYTESFVGPRMEDLISRGIYSMTEVKKVTISDFYNAIKNEDSRSKLRELASEDSTRDFLDELETLPREEIIGTERALGRIALDPFIRSYICNPEDNGILNGALDEDDLILINLDRGIIGYEDSRILSNIFAVYIWFLLSTRRTGNYFFFLEEAQDYQSRLISDMISSGRKFGLRIFFVTTSFKGISSNLEAMFFSNISNYIIFRMTEPDKNEFVNFMGEKFQFPSEPRKFILLSGGMQLSGETDAVSFSPGKSGFTVSNYKFVTEQSSDELRGKLQGIFELFDECENLFFVFEVFAKYLNTYEKKVVIQEVKEMSRNNPKVHYVGRTRLDTEGITGRFEIFEYSGSGKGTNRLPDIFLRVSEGIEKELKKK
ncbi:MAG: ATP-binding protein [Candidatus Thermoplasmatota archaeon]|jgi:energy-coupling factor transporter ATP-binding protein EcfA2|nr:ATP-binding protein [Candidatus Thermoplasmatota archaeon]